MILPKVVFIHTPSNVVSNLWPFSQDTDDIVSVISKAEFSMIQMSTHDDIIEFSKKSAHSR